jgi:hypothetical protein
MLDLAEAGGLKNEKQLRLSLLMASEQNIRDRKFPDLHARRSRNMQTLFELLRQSHVPSVLNDDFWLEARLLRLLERHDQCRQLCQTRPMYEWTFAVLQEFVWASRGDSCPYPRRTAFENESDVQTANQLFLAAKTLHESKCYQWQQAYDAMQAPNKAETRASNRTDIGLLVIITAAALFGYFYSWWAGLMVFFFGSSILFSIFNDGKEMNKVRVSDWFKENPKPYPMALTLYHLPPPNVHVSIGSS